MGTLTPGVPRPYSLHPRAPRHSGFANTTESHLKETTPMTITTRFTQTAKLALIAGLITLAPTLASAQAPRCTILTGTYSFTFSGTAIFPGSSTPVPFAGIGIQTFDGSGKWTGTESANFGAFVLRNAAFSGTYTLNPDCTGTMTAKFPDGSTGHQDFVVTQGGASLIAVGTDITG